MPALQALAGVPSFGAQLGQALGGGLSQGIGAGLSNWLESKKNMQTGTALADYLGQPEMASALGQLPQNIQLEIARSHTSGKMQKQLEKENAIQIGVETIKRMRELLPSAGPTNFISGLFGGETTRNRAELETLGRSLIPLVAAGVPIRNQKEFEEYRKVITNPNSRQSELEGALSGLENLFQRSLTHGNVREEKTEKVEGSTKLSESKAKEILKKAGNDPEKARKIAKKLGYEF